jgi:hypothetical protein
MGSDRFAVAPPVGEIRPGIGRRGEDCFIEVLVPPSAIETLGNGVLRRLVIHDVVSHDPMLLRRAQHHR